MTAQKQVELIELARRTRARTLRALIGSGARRLRGAARGLLRDWRLERARSELRALSDRTLADIGLTRPQIETLYR